jgi:hypothetical protein
MTDPSRTATLTILLASDEPARRLAVSWPLVAGAAADAATIAEWAHVAGVPRSVAARAALVLFRHGVCRPDHTTDPEALRIVQHFAAEQLRATQRRAR